MASSYTDELKAKVIAEWMAGSSLNQLASLHNVPKPTVQNWVRGHERLSIPVSIPKKVESFDLDGMAWELVGESFGALRAILRKAQDDRWLDKQDANTLAIFFGVTSDKLIRLLAARKDDPGINDATALT